MASSSLTSVTPPAAAVALPKSLIPAGRLQPMNPPAGKSCASRRRSSRLEVRASASMKERAVSVATAAALVAALAAPEIAEAAGPGVSPSLKNFLLSIVSGGVVVAVIIGAVVGVSNFDPVKRG